MARKYRVTTGRTWDAGATLAREVTDVAGVVDAVSEDIPDVGWIDGWGYPTWQDEFDNTVGGVPTLDLDKWNVKDREANNLGQSFGLLSDASVIQQEQCTVTADKHLRIRAEWLTSPEITSSGPQGNPTYRWHKTGYLDHRNTTAANVLYSQQYGIWEYRVKLPMSQYTSLGTLGAIWLRNASTGEFDITEGWGDGPANKPAVANLHPAGNKPFPWTTTTTIHTQTAASNNMKTWWTHSPPVYDEWHTYRLTWTPDLMKLEIDGVTKFSITPSSTIRVADYSTGTWVESNISAGYLWTNPAFTQPWHIRMNLHIGTSTAYWGLPNPDHHEWTPDPQDMLVDYVRMYEYVP